MNRPDYGMVDRLLHRLAFASPAVQDRLAGMEQSLWQEAIAAQAIDRPIFVCSLPRAGTTLLLELLALHPDCVSQTYRDMPFVRSPVLWRHLSRRFWTKAEATERFHGDGMAFDADSVEAFEEVVWTRHFPELFGERGIEPLTGSGEAVRHQLGMHIRRVLAAQADAEGNERRYLSKNNANISRTQALRSAFPDARLVVPLRNPVDQARSLHRQYINFLSVHAQDGFALRYMRDLGHFEFGLLHRPILFPGVGALAQAKSPADPDFWLEYWRLSFEYLAGQKGLALIDYDRLHEAGSMEALLEAAALPQDAAAIAEARRRIRPGNPGKGAMAGKGAQGALRLYEKLRNGPDCVNRAVAGVRSLAS